MLRSPQKLLSSALLGCVLFASCADQSVEQEAARLPSGSVEAETSSQPGVRPSPLPPLGSAQMEAIVEEKAARTPAQQKLCTPLLHAWKMQQAQPLAEEVPPEYAGVEVDSEGTVLVDIDAEVTQAVLTRIEALGGKIISKHPQYRAIRARLPLLHMETLAKHVNVNFLCVAAKPEFQGGATAP